MLVFCSGAGALRNLASNRLGLTALARCLSPSDCLYSSTSATTTSRRSRGGKRPIDRGQGQVPKLQAQAIEFDLEDEADFEEVDLPKKSLPAEVRCFDTARINVEAGCGGRGCTAFRREKFVPKGGPSGGNGGEGGSVWMEAHAGLNSLSSFRRQVHFKATPGAPGSGSNKHGASGKDTVITVPPGTVVRRNDDGDVEVIAELLHAGQRALLATGGRGGRGNASFKTAADNAPTMSEHGEKGQEMWLDLELKLVADVGIIGVPNAGKSTLLSVVSAAKPKVAPYPFTTLTPNLGVCELDFRTTVFADIPGLLEGAHTGTGLGHEFLRHTQRCRLLIHVVDGSSPDPVGDWKAIQTELELFNPELLDKPQGQCFCTPAIWNNAHGWTDAAASAVRIALNREMGFVLP
ncbi:hypothetical protein WJX84_007503 [Apatococcus fuscideae]|uniref:Uncharacterized protein n=1 Tax=Apatococcus fuscideae TaxID=2026836 RepID=A0AAW1RNL9_9CHLO